MSINTNETKRRVNISVLTLVKKLRRAQEIKQREIDGIINEIEDFPLVKEKLGTIKVRYEYLGRLNDFVKVVRIAFGKATMIPFSLADKVENEDNVLVPNEALNEIHYADFYDDGKETTITFIDDFIIWDFVNNEELKNLLCTLTSAILKYDYLNNSVYYITYNGKDNTSELSIDLNGNIKFRSMPVNSAMSVLRRVRIPKDELPHSFDAAVRLANSKGKI